MEKQMLVLIEEVATSEGYSIHQVVGTTRNIILADGEKFFLKSRDKLQTLRKFESLINDQFGKSQVPLFSSEEPAEPGPASMETEPTIADTGPEQGPQWPIELEAPGSGGKRQGAPVGALEATSESAPGPLDELLVSKAKKENLPFLLNDDAGPVKQVLNEEIANKISLHYDTLSDRNKERLAHTLARVKVQTRVKYKHILPPPLKMMISTIVLNRGGPSKHMTPSESVFLGDEMPEFGLTKEAPPASIPEGFGQRALGPSTEYRSADELMSMLSGGESKTSSS